MSPGFDLPFLAVATVSLRLGKTDEALESLKEAVAINPKLKAQLARNESFASLRADPAFVAITTGQ